MRWPGAFWAADRQSASEAHPVDQPRVAARLGPIALGLHAWLSPEAIQRIKDAASRVLSSSALEANIAKQFAAKLNERP